VKDLIWPLVPPVPPLSEKQLDIRRTTIPAKLVEEESRTLFKSERRLIINSLTDWYWSHHVYRYPQPQATMPTTRGTFLRTAPNRVTAVFVIDDIQTIFNAVVQPAIEVPFNSTSATLTYDDVGSLTSSRPYSGHIGPDKFELTLHNGPTIKGELNAPGVDFENIIDGTGVWEQS
jgi:hypothetical protein